MKTVVFFLFFVGLIMIIHGIYDQKVNDLNSNVRVEYRFIPRTYYEEQLSNSSVSSQFKNMFTKESPWYDRNISIGGPPDLKSQSQ